MGPERLGPAGAAVRSLGVQGAWLTFRTSFRMEQEGLLGCWRDDQANPGDWLQSVRDSGSGTVGCGWTLECFFKGKNKPRIKL